MIQLILDEFGQTHQMNGIAPYKKKILCKITSTFISPQSPLSLMMVHLIPLSLPPVSSVPLEPDEVPGHPPQHHAGHHAQSRERQARCRHARALHHEARQRGEEELPADLHGRQRGVVGGGPRALTTGLRNYNKN